MSVSESAPAKSAPATSLPATSTPLSSTTAGTAPTAAPGQTKLLVSESRAGVRLLRALVHAVGAAVFVWPLALTESVVAAAVGSALAALAAPSIARSRLRASSLIALGAAMILLAGGFRGLLTGTEAISSSLGPANALRFGDLTFFFIAAAGVTTGLRVLASRYRPLAALEVLALTSAFGQLVIAHRQGAINRPFELADPILQVGGDPTVIFFAVGGCAVAMTVLLLLRDSGPRTFLHLAVISLLLLLFLSRDGVLEMPAPPPGGAGLGLRPDGEGDEESDEERDGEGGGDASNPNNDLEFQDDIESQQEQQAPVAVVLFHDDYSAPTGTYYFRQGAFSQYNGNRMVSASGAGFDSDIARDFPLRAYDIAGAPDANANRMTVQTTVALLAEHTRPFGLEAPITLQPATNPDPERFRRTYSVTSAVMISDFVAMLGSTVGDPVWTPEMRVHYTQGPDDPRYAELAHRILEESLPPHLMHDPIAQVAAITSWLGQEGIYSLRSSHAQADDPTADFLFGDKTGYCVHFAHAGTYLLRSIGVPTRVATGYAVAEENRRGGSALLIAGNTSHAWPEVYVDGFGWVVTDIAPQTVLSAPGPPPDADLQRLLGELARGLRPIPPDPDAPLPAAIARGVDLLKLGGVALALFAALALLAMVFWKSWRAVVPRFATDKSAPRIVYRAALDRLSENRLSREDGESREAFAERISKMFPSFRQLTQLNVAAAFGSQRSSSSDTALKHFAALKAELRTEIPLWRRALGVLTPWSWMYSR